MCVLQNTLGIIGHIHSQVFLVQPVPLCRQIIHGKTLVKNLFLHLIANQDMERIGQFVCLRPDQAGASHIDCTVKVLSYYTLHLLWEQLFHLREDQLAKSLASADIVLPKPGLGFVNGRSGSVTQRRVQQIVGYA